MGSYFLKITAETVKFLSNLSVRSLNWEGRFAMSSHFFILLKNSIKLKISNRSDLTVWFLVGFIFSEIHYTFYLFTTKVQFLPPKALIKWLYCKHDNVLRASPSPINKDELRQLAKYFYILG